MGEKAGDRELIVAVARDLIAVAAPEEAATVFRPVSAAYFDKPGKSRPTSKDDMLGFGVGEAVIFLTPVALSVVSDVVVYLRGELAKAAARDAAGALDDMVRSLFRRFRGGEASAQVPGLTREQIAEVRRLAFEKARLMGISEARSQLLADATAGSLVLAT